MRALSERETGGVAMLVPFFPLLARLLPETSSWFPVSRPRNRDEYAVASSTGTVGNVMVPSTKLEVGFGPEARPPWDGTVAEDLEAACGFAGAF